MRFLIIVLGLLALLVFSMPLQASQVSENICYIQLINPPPDAKWWVVGWNGNTGGPVPIGWSIKLSTVPGTYPVGYTGISIVTYAEYGVDTFNGYWGGCNSLDPIVNPFTPLPGQLWKLDCHSQERHDSLGSVDLKLVGSVPAGFIVGNVLPRVNVTVATINVPTDVTSWYVWEVQLPDGGSMVQEVIASIDKPIKINLPALCGVMGGFKRADGTRYNVTFDQDWCLNEEGAVYQYDFNIQRMYRLSSAVFTNSIGDVNGDGEVDMGDVITIERQFLGLNPVTAAADVNKDGKVNMLDVTKVERLILGLDSGT
jgi:hypothetical protein